MANRNKLNNPRLRKDAALATHTYPNWAHPDVVYAEPDWTVLRDSFEGERAVKAATTDYLPQPSGMDDDEYAFYIENATYYNMVARTVGALVGTVFKKNPVLTDIPKKLIPGLRTITKDNESLRAFSMRVTKEVIHMGRFGVLVDRPNNGNGTPYLVGYVAEAIIDWTVEVGPDGRNILTEVVLMEAEEAPRTANEPRRFLPMYRVLRLIEGIYQQHIYKTSDNTNTPDITAEADEVVTPTNRGVYWDRIPFEFFGSESNLPRYERSPMIDIARLNISHFRSYAHLEHGRYYTGLPVFYVSKNNGSSGGSYTIGPSTVWEVGQGEKAGLLEFNGNGLKFLENALSSKEAQAASLGGRLIGVDTRSVSESDNQVSMKNRNEQALLLSVTLALDEGFSRLLGLWARWQDVSKEIAASIEIEFNKEFLLKETSAREFRAIHSMWKDGLLPLQVVYDYLLRAEVIPEWMKLEEFTKLLNSMDSFPNNPDVEAKKDGFPDRKTELMMDDNKLQRQADEDLQNSAQAHNLKLARENGKRTSQNNNSSEE
jgi:hypothetical protein